MTEDAKRSFETVLEATTTDFASANEFQTSGTGLREELDCPHKNRKGLFRSAALRKKLKANLKKRLGVNYCEDCTRLDPPEQQQSIWICVTCSYFGCNNKDHTLNHFKALRSGTEHPLFFDSERGKFRCFSCEKELDTAEDASGLMKTFLNDYNSFMKTKLKSDPAVQSYSVKGGSTSESSLCAQEMDSKKIRKDSKKTLSENKTKISAGESLLPVKGLINLGNTCFFNSIIQCLLHTHSLAVYTDLVGREDNIEIMPSRVVVGDKQVEIPHVYLSLNSFDGPLNNIFANFIRDFRAGKAIHPSSLFSEIARKAPRFRGWAQQDAHELLRYLLDGLRTEEFNRYKEAIARYVKATRNSNPKLTDNELTLLAKGMLKACGRPLIDAVFGGTLLQTVKCSECGHLSKTYEDFLDLSLPLPSTSTKTLFSDTHKMHKSTSLSLSKHQKKKMKSNARKGRIRRRSHEIFTRNGNENEIDRGMERFDDEIDESDDDAVGDDVDATNLNGAVCNEMSKLKINISGTDTEDCLQLLDNEEVMEDECRSLASCLRAFTATEILSTPNTYECEKCCVPHNKQLRNGMKKRTVEAEKRYLIYEPPPVLTLHLKRFEQTHSISGRVMTRKVPGQISFPKILNIAPFCTKTAKRIEKGLKKVCYLLYGVVSHSGDLSSGHYVAYVRNRCPSPQTEKFFYEAANIPPPNTIATCTTSELEEMIEGANNGEWFYASDMRVNAVSESRVLGAEGYILFYERIY